MTDQEIYDRVAEHLLKQGRRCVAEDLDMSVPINRYRNVSGLACAVGCLIPLDVYKPYMEKMPSFQLLINGVIPGVDLDQHRLLENLMSIHDRSAPSSWRARLIELAELRGLLPFPRHLRKE